nr:sulfotransferase 16 [Tanacetum cinerariifolium]
MVIPPPPPVKQPQIAINNVNDPLYIANSDHPGMVLTNTSFNGTNFHGWSRDVKMALETKLKLGFIDGSCNRPSVDSVYEQRWIGMAFRNFIYDENEENLSFLPKEPSHGLGNGSLSVSVNTDPLSVDAEPSLKLVEDIVDFGGSSKPEQREKAREEECEELRSKCEATLTDFKKNPTMVAMREKLSTLSIEAKEHKANLDRMLLESQKWAGYHVSLSALESKVASLEADKARLEAVEASLNKEVDDVKRDKIKVVLKVIPYAALKLIHSDELCRLVGKLVSSAILYRRCDAFEQVADMKEPFDLLKVKGYHPSYKKEYTQAGNELATASFSWLSEFVADPSHQSKFCCQKASGSPKACSLKDSSFCAGILKSYSIFYSCF